MGMNVWGKDYNLLLLFEHPYNFYVNFHSFTYAMYVLNKCILTWNIQRSKSYISSSTSYLCFSMFMLVHTCTELNNIANHSHWFRNIFILFGGNSIGKRTVYLLLAIHVIGNRGKGFSFRFSYHPPPASSTKPTSIRICHFIPRRSMFEDPLVYIFFSSISSSSYM